MKKTAKTVKKLKLKSEKVRDLAPKIVKDENLQDIAGGVYAASAGCNSVSHYG